MDRKEKTFWTNIGALFVALVLLVLCLTMTGRISKKIALVVDQIELTNRDSVTVGQNSDIYFHHVPKDFLIIAREGNHYRWRVNNQYHDSLQYFKVNNVNPNKFVIKNDESQHIVLNLPTSYRDTLKLSFTGKDVWKTWKSRFSKQKDVLARHFATNYRIAQDSVSAQDSLAFLNQMQCHAVRSFFEKDGNTIVLVILDELTKIQEKGQDGKETEIGYVRSGITSDTGEEAGHCKVQFFTVSTHCYLDKSPEEGTFQINGVNHVMKASVKLTEWGAGHVMISNGEKEHSMLISFPKPVSFVGTVDSLRVKSKQSSDLITLKQNNNSFPNKSDLYLPAFSNAINFDLCNIEFFHKDDSVVIRDNNFKTTLVENPTTSFLPVSLVPAFKKIDLGSGNDVLHARMGYINRSFFLSYLWLPIIVFILLLLLIWLPISPMKPTEQLRTNAYNFAQLDSYRGYLSLLLVVCLLYCVCKSMIAIKLSYTYPYFEKLTGIIPVATSLLMLLFFSLVMVINAPFLHMNAWRGREGQRQKKTMKLWLAWVVCAAIFLGLTLVFFRNMDGQISSGMISSYFHHEVFIWKFWRWTSPSAVGINDTHRSVVYTLLLIGAVVLFVWLVFNFKYDYLAEKVKKVISKWTDWVKHLNSLVGQGINQLCSSQGQILQQVPTLWEPIAKRLLLVLTIAALLLVYGFIAWITPLPGLPTTLIIVLLVVGAFMVGLEFVYDAFIGMLKVLFPSHFLLLALIVTAGVTMGNFGTAFITLGVVLGLCRALSVTVAELSDQSSCRPPYTILFQMFLIVSVYTVAAMVGDNGYMTNFLGFTMCMISFFFLVKRRQARNDVQSKQARKEKTWVTRTLLLICVLAWLMPMICSKIFNPENVNYSRMSRRVMLYSNFDDLQKSGYRYSESDAEFMVIMSHYMQGDSLSRKNHDPLSNDAHFMHPSVSSGQSPVALNDLSVPIAFFGSYGSVMTHIVYFMLLALLMWIVMRHTIGYIDDRDNQLTKTMQWRLMAMFMWVGTSLYIYFSYIDWLPFTGRLNPGFGVDAVGEALETAFLLAFMGSVTGRKK